MIDLSGLFNDAFAQAARAAQQSAFDGVFGQSVPRDFQEFSRQKEAQSSQVTREDEARMVIRRAANICQDARDRGWTARFEGSDRICRVVFRSSDGRFVVGKNHTSRKVALITATEDLATYGFLRED